MTRGSSQALSRRRVLAGTAVAAALLVSLIGLAEGLRHPPAEAPSVVELDEEDPDPRLPFDCPEPEPREDLDRDPPATLAPFDPPIEVSADELLNCPGSFDRRTVRYRGEVIGGLMDRAGGVWAQLNDDAYARTLGPLPAHREYRGANVGIGVLLPPEAAAGISTVGGPQTRGDLVEVVGVFRRVEPATREVTVIRASEVAVVRPGDVMADAVQPARRVAAGLLALVAAAMVAAERVASRRRRR